jgi:hypothetical protein
MLEQERRDEVQRAVNWEHPLEDLSISCHQQQIKQEVEPVN